MPATSETPAPTTACRYCGEVVFLFAYDITYELGRAPIEKLLGQPVVPYRVDFSRPSPRQWFMHQPLMVRLPVQSRIGPHGAIAVERTVKLLPIGAISIRSSLPMS